MKRRHFLQLGAPAALAGLPLATWAQGNSQQPIRLQVGATPGGGTDIVARAMARAMEAELKRVIVVENKPGAAGNIAASAVANAPADPGVLLLAYTSHAINPSIQARLPFDTLRNFTPISLSATSPLLLVAHPALPASNMAELLAHGKARPGTLSIAGAGLGSASQLAGDMLKVQAGLDIVSVPYKGAAPAVQDLLGGQVQLLLSNVATVRPFLASGKLKALGVSTPQRLPAYPDVAPIADVLPGFDYRTWYGVLAPSGLTPAQIAQLEGAAQRGARSADVVHKLKHEGLEPVGSSSAEFQAFIEAEMTRWQAVAQRTGARLG